MVFLRPRLARPVDRPAIRSLHEAVFGPWPGDDAWDWKYDRSGMGEGFSLVLEHPDGRLFAHAGARMCWGNCPQGLGLLAQVTDLMVLPESRGAGVFRALLGELLLHLGARDPNVFVYGFAGLRPFRLGARLGFYHPIAALYRVPPREMSGGPAQPQPLRPDHLLSVRSAGGVGRLGPFHRLGYLSWRYLRHPTRSYFFSDGAILTQWGGGEWWAVEGQAPAWAWSWCAQPYLDRGFGPLAPEPLMIAGQITRQGQSPHCGLDRFAFQPGDTDVL